MRQQIHDWWAHSWLWLSIGAFIGMIAGPGSALDSLWALYDEHFPVVRAASYDPQRVGDGVVFGISGEKLRPCIYGSAYAYVVRNGQQVEANLERLDQRSIRHTRPVGAFDAGLWRVWPVTGATSANVYWTYTCAGRIVLSPVVVVLLS